MTPAEHFARTWEPDDLVRFDLKSGFSSVFYLCPGCGGSHSIPVFGCKTDAGHGWEWNGDYKRPTFSPSINAYAGDDYRCHHFVRDGVMEILGDSTQNGGKKLPLPAVSE